MTRFAPSPDPSLSIKFYERTPEQQSVLGYVVDSSRTGQDPDVASTNAIGPDQVQRVPHGSIGAGAGHRAIAQSNTEEISEALFRYSAPEEVHHKLNNFLHQYSISYVPICKFFSRYFCHCMLTGDDFPINMWNLYCKM